MIRWIRRPARKGLAQRLLYTLEVTLMIPTQDMLDSVATEIATDTTILAAALFLTVALVAAPFVPGAGLLVGSLVLASFTGSTPKANTTAVMLKYTDPATTEWLIEVPPPVGGWHWQVVTNVTNLPQTIYGYALLDSTGAILYGTALLPAPRLLTAIGQGIDLPPVNFRLNAQALS